MSIVLFKPAKLVKIMIMIILLCSAASFLLEAATIKFKVVAANPSQVKRQRVPIQVYLPEEVKPTDIIDLGGLNLEFDAEKSLYYVYNENIFLEPKEIRTFEVEINDIWLIPEGDIATLDTKVKYLLKAFEASEYEDQMKTIAEQFDLLSAEISKTQNDDGMSRSQHIGIFRTNSRALDSLKEKILEMERILQRQQGPLTPDMLAKTKFKTDAPTKTATWIAIFIIIFFLGLISVIVFFTWYRQGKATEKILAEAKKDAFVDFGEDKDKKKKE
ncbi:MAG: hypothetical protein JW867_01935 [Candidatus Omnitrophica bacterium]|nr:hypothetical protein [Candidatus Omnitrophota bacterium]